MKLRIENPCPIKWEEMSNIDGGKFCESCSKKVWDLDDLTRDEAEILLSNKQNQICGKISKTRIALAASLLIAVSINSVSCSSMKHTDSTKSEIKTDRIIKISGKISAAENVEINPTEIKIVTRKKLFTGKVYSDRNFEIEIPESQLKDHNILKINYTKKIENTSSEDYSLQIISKKDLLAHKTIIADDGTFEIGAVVIVSPAPPDFYYFNGKSISEGKFKKLRAENPGFERIVLDEDAFKNLITNQYSGTLYLLFSK